MTTANPTASPALASHAPAQKLHELAKTIRSKNAGVNKITFDIIFREAAQYERVKRSRVLNRESMAALFGVPVARIKRLGNTVIVENRPGVAGVLGADYVAKSPRDGSVLLLTSSTFLTAAATQARSPYDPLTAFAPVALVADGPLLLAVSSTLAASKSIRTAAELIAAARAKPGAITYGSAGVGSLGQLATELLCDASRVQMMHVPYKGAANALIDLAAGQIDVMMSNYSSIATQIKSGKVKPLAVTSATPNPAFPELPTLAASVPGYGIEIWVGVLAPAGTPAALVQRLNREIAEIAASPEVRVVLEPDGSRPLAVTSAEFGARMKHDLAQWKRIAADRKIIAE
ncbi:tripartite tricarboxylate transporter substrate-binding protein [Cupriavidus sp. NPDC089707]|uniref:tripartite tricarboxylate transporter substrate-binding protein n=1 Tax=Cupriavidus sp. NPDC089707 TaxID=3363963 RepID=UPI0037FA3950